jgi:hypothetical protein
MKLFFLPKLNNETLELGQVGKRIIDEMKNWCSSREKGLAKLSGGVSSNLFSRLVSLGAPFDLIIWFLYLRFVCHFILGCRSTEDLRCSHKQFAFCSYPNAVTSKSFPCSPKMVTNKQIIRKMDHNTKSNLHVS